jgi:hypothetical protein
VVLGIERREKRKKIWNDFQASDLSDLGSGVSASNETRFVGFGFSGITSQ